jgi:hypothetical protein
MMPLMNGRKRLMPRAANTRATVRLLGAVKRERVRDGVPAAAGVMTVAGSTGASDEGTAAGEDVAE